MLTSLFLAKFFSIYFFIIGLAMLSCTASFRSRALSYANHEGLMLLGGIITLLLGIFLILVHSYWVYNWHVLITVLAWLTFVKGIVHVLCPDIAKRMIQKMDNQNTYRIGGLICLALAVYLGYHGFGM
jgi:uncharacterized protein YjeT (DUF2065 family)